MTGLVSHLSGQAAEDRVADRYLARGHRLLARRWRGPAGEIDLVFGKGGEVIFVEVKSSRSLGAAALRVSPRQRQRLLASAEAGLGYFPKGSLTPMRFDVALVAHDGRIEIVANALHA